MTGCRTSGRIAERIIRCVVLVVVLAGMSGEAFSAPMRPEGIEWRLVEAGGAPAAPLSGRKQPHLMLDPAQRKVSGFTGCNNFFGTYELAGASLTFGPVGSTRRACPEPEMSLEGTFLNALEKTRGWKISGGMLLLVAGDELLARFTTGAEREATADPGAMTYRLRSLPEGTVTIKGGEYRAPAAPDSASEVIVKLTDRKAFGTVQGRDAGAVILVTSLGGTGSFYELALLSRRPEGWENTDTVLLGDRVRVHGVRIENDQVVAAMTAHGPDDPLCCPTIEVSKRFMVRDERLVPVSEGSADEGPQIVGTVWQWVQTLYGNDTKAVPAKRENYTVRFLENGSVAVKADCNLKGGTYSLGGRKLSIQITHSTMAACEAGSLEERFVRDLTGGSVVFMKDGDLFIDLEYDSGTMRFSRQ